MSALVVVQVAAEQAPFVHVEPVAHLTPQPPQLLTSVAVPIQAEPQRVPVVQVGLQTLAAQDVAPPVGAVHLMPQPPQLFTSVVVVTHADPQSVPVVQVGLQALAAQDVAPPVGAVHLMPQPPQLFTSVVVVAQVPLQLTWPDAQQTPPGQATQAPPLHWAPVAQFALVVQVVVQALAPQMKGVQAFVAGVTHAPLPLQEDAGCAVPAVQDAAPQLVPETKFRQAPAPLQVPSRPQGSAFVQRLSAPPVRIGAQAPLA